MSSFFMKMIDILVATYIELKQDLTPELTIGYLETIPGTSGRKFSHDFNRVSPARFTDPA